MADKLLKLLLLLLLVNSCFSATFASGTDTAAVAKKFKKPKVARDSTIVSFFYNDFEKIGQLNTHAYDTAIAGFQNYDALYKKDRFSENLGNIGSIYQNLVPYPFVKASGWDFGIHTFDAYMFLNDSVRF